MTQSTAKPKKTDDVLRLSDTGPEQVDKLLSSYGLTLRVVDLGEDIPGSFWGNEEAGLIGDELLVREDTPLHSILHEASHYICMDRDRREGLYRRGW